MDKYSEYVESAMKKISWKTIADYYKMTNIEWTFTNTEGIKFKRVPNIADIKEDFKNAANILLSKNLRSFDYGNWLFFWTDEETAKLAGLSSPQIEAIFVLTSALVTNDGAFESVNVNSTDELENQLQEAIENEDYTLAAALKLKIENIAINHG